MRKPDRVVSIRVMAAPTFAIVGWQYVAAVVAATTLRCDDSDDDFGSEINSVCDASVGTPTESRGQVLSMR